MYDYSIDDKLIWHNWILGTFAYKIFKASISNIFLCYVSALKIDYLGTGLFLDFKKKLKVFKQACTKKKNVVIQTKKYLNWSQNHNMSPNANWIWGIFALKHVMLLWRWRPSLILLYSLQQHHMT